MRGAEAPRSPARRMVRATLADAILDGAEEVALDAGLDGLTIARVAERAGVAVGTLYNHFTDREAIIAALFRARRAAIHPLIDQAAEDTKALPFEPRLREFVRRLMIAFAQEKKFLRLSMLSDRDGSVLKPQDASVMRRTIEALEQIMRAGAKLKRFPASAVPLYARMLHGALRAIFVWRITDGESFCADGRLVVETFLRGVHAPE